MRSLRFVCSIVTILVTSMVMCSCSAKLSKNDIEKTTAPQTTIATTTTNPPTTTRVTTTTTNPITTTTKPQTTTKEKVKSTTVKKTMRKMDGNSNFKKASRIEYFKNTYTYPFEGTKKEFRQYVISDLVDQSEAFNEFVDYIEKQYAVEGEYFSIVNDGDVFSIEETGEDGIIVKTEENFQDALIVDFMKTHMIKSVYCNGDEVSQLGYITSAKNGYASFMLIPLHDETHESSYYETVIPYQWACSPLEF